MMRVIKNLLGSKTVFAAAVVYSCLTTFLFFMPTSGLPKVGISQFDKIVHNCIFITLSILWQLYFYIKGVENKRKFILLFLLIMLVYGILIEVFQELFTASRTADPFDVIANMIGVVIGIVVFNYVKSGLNLKK